MEFKVKKIHRGKNIKNKFWRKIVRFLGPKKAFLIVFLLCFSSVLFAGHLVLKSDFFSGNIRRIVKLSPLQRDTNEHTNILFLGVAGKNEEGGNLSDSILLFSIDPRNPSASFISFPRDLFISSEIGEHKINEIYARARWEHLKPMLKGKSVNEVSPKVIEKAELEGLEITKKAISEFTGVEVHYGAVVNFNVFEQIVDNLGGVNVYVLNDIHDPFYPDNNYGYQTFTMRKGLQHLDGATALKYARSRKTSSDYDRAQRQQDLLLAIRKKASEINLLTDFDKLKSFYATFKSNITTDLGLTEIIALAKLGVSINYQNSLSVVLNDDPTRKGGFLYTPAREFYGGQFVLLPKNLRDTQKFIDLLLVHPEVLLENAQISVLNGSKISGYAGKMAARLRRFGFHVIDVGNYQSDLPIFRSFFYDYSQGSMSGTIDFLKNFLDLKEMSPLQETRGLNAEDLLDLQIILGTN